MNGQLYQETFWLIVAGRMRVVRLLWKLSSLIDTIHSYTLINESKSKLRVQFGQIYNIGEPTFISEEKRSESERDIFFRKVHSLG